MSPGWVLGFLMSRFWMALEVGFFLVVGDVVLTIFVGIMVWVHLMVDQLLRFYRNRCVVLGEASEAEAFRDGVIALFSVMQVREGLGPKAVLRFMDLPVPESLLPVLSGFLEADGYLTEEVEGHGLAGDETILRVYAKGER